MNVRPWTKATEFLAEVFNCPPSTPLNQQQLETITSMKVTEHCVGISCNNATNAEPLSASLLQQPQPFERMQNLSCLTIEQADQGIHWKRVLRALSALPQVKQLTLVGKQYPQQTFPIKEIEKLAQSAEKLELKNLSAESLAQLPKEMPQLDSLEIEGEIDWQLLSQIHLPKLKILHLHRLTGLSSISQMSQAFPSLQKLILDDVRTVDGLPLELGKVHLSLYYLDVSVDELTNWTQPTIGIDQMRIRNCSFDPSFLQSWGHLRALELKNCWLEAPIPPLAGCSDLNYLLINDCAVTDFEFAKGLHALQLFNIEKNGVEVSRSLEEGQLPANLACLADMPNLLEFVVEKKVMDILLEKCPKLFARYQAVLPDMLRLKV